MAAKVFPYNLISLLAIPVLLPLSMIGLKGRKAARLGLHLPSGFRGSGSIWIHALSVGELLSALPLVAALKERHPQRPIAFSVATASGMRLGEERLRGKADLLFYSPIDLFWNSVRIISRIRPALFVVVETDLWPGLLSTLKAKGVPRLLANGRISPATLSSYRRFPLAARWLYGNLSLCLMQSALDRDRLMQVMDLGEKVIVTGNMKYDRTAPVLSPEERKGWLDLMGFGGDDPIWVVGSIHRGEEDIVLKAYLRVLKAVKGLRLILAPRRQDECQTAVKKASELGLRAVLRSSLPGTHGADVVVMDTIGELERIYSLGAVSFVGGSLVPIGGHNLLEPAAHGCAVLFGPHTENFVEMSEMLLSAGGALRVKDGHELASQVEALFLDPERRTGMGERARIAVSANAGAVGRVMEAIDSLLGEGRTLPGERS
jgi:3-deoxy-D-manno-octulosonic-acid transferase